MPFDFTDMFTDLLDAENYGEMVNYTAPGGSPAGINVGWSEPDMEGEQREDGHRLRRVATALVLVSDLASPVRKGKVTRNGEDWQVEKVDKKGGVAWKLSLVRIEPTEHAARPFRIR